MLAKEEKQLLELVTPVVERLLRKMDDRWTAREISQATGVPTSRLTEYRDYARYQRRISFKNLIRIIGSGIFTMEDIVKEAGESLTQKQKTHLIDMSFYEDPTFRRLAVENKKKGVGQLELQAIVSQLLDEGIDVLSALKGLKKL